MFNAGDMAGAANALKGLSTEAIAATTRFMGFGDAESALAMKLQGCSADVIAQRLALDGAGEATVRAALQATSFKDAEIDAAIGATTFTAAENASTGATNAFTVSIKNAAKGLWTFLTTNPAGWAILAATAIFGIIKAFDYFNKAQDRAIEKAQAAQDAYRDAQAEVDNLKSQLEGLNSQIDELQSKGSLSLTDQAELHRLERERDVLQQQLSIQEAIAALKGADAAQAAHDALNTKKVTALDGQIVGVVAAANGGLMQANIDDFQARGPIELADAQRHALETMTADRERFIQQYAQQSNQLTEQQAKEYERGLATYDRAIAHQKTLLGDTLTTLSDTRNALVNPVTGDIFAGYENDVARIDEMCQSVEQSLTRTAAVVEKTTIETPLAMSKNTRAAYNALDTLANDKSIPARQRAEELGGAGANYLQALAADQEAMSFTIDIKAESEGLDQVQSALKEAASATGLTDESMAKLASRFSSLKSYDPSALFLNTANGVKINADELTRLEAEMAKANNTGLEQRLTTAKEQLADVNAQLANSTNLTSSEIAALINKKQELIGNIQAAQQLSAQYAALTSNYQKWIAAQNGPEEGDVYDSVRTGLENAQKLFSEGLVGTNEFKEYVDLLSGKDLSTASVSEITAEWQRLNKEITTASGQKIGFKATDFLKEGSAGVENFLSALEKVNMATKDAEGNWRVTAASIQDIASAFKLDEEFVESMFGKLKDYGAEIEVAVKDAYGNAITSVESAMAQLDKSGKLGDLEINVETTDLQTAHDNMVAFESVYAKFLNEDGTITLDANDQDMVAAYTVMSALYDNWLKLQNADSVVMQVDSSGITESSENSDQLLKAMQDLTTQKQELAKAQALGLDTEAAEQGVADATAKVVELYDLLNDDQKKALDIQVSQDGVVDIQNLMQQISELDKEKLITLGVSENRIPDELENNTPDTHEVTLKIGDNQVQIYLDDPTHSTSSNIKKNAVTSLETWLSGPHSISVNVIPSGGIGGFQGTAHMTGSAYAGGNWGLKQGEYALTGERGPELWVDVSTGRWHTTGENGAEFTRLPKGAIVFNHKQTEQLLKYGHINSRGKALAGGNAFELGSGVPDRIYSSNGFRLPSSSSSGSKAASNASKAAAGHAKKAASDVSKAAKDVSDTASAVEEESSKTADWVEKVLENLEKKADKYISRAEKKAENGNFAGAAKQYRKAEQVYANEMSKQKDAESIYASQAAKVLKDAVAQGKITDSQSKDIERKVANGAMELSKLSEGTEKIVSEYEEYYDKAIAAADATAEIYDKYEEVAKSLYQLPLDQVEEDTKQLDNEMDLLEKRLELTDESTKKTALMEEQMANARAKHAAQIDSYDKAHNNYITALRKINESSDQALKGLTESQKQMITELVAAGEKIDYSSIVGASDEAKRAIIDYNASLEVQRQALYDVQMSSMETALSLRELAAAIANQPIEDANEQIDKRQRPREVRNAQYDVAQTAEDQNRLLAQEIAGAKRDEKSRKDALDKVEDELDKAWNDGALVALRNTAAGAGKKFGEKITENEVAAAMQELSATGKLTDNNGKVIKKGSEEYRKAYDQMLSKARAYNAGLAARNTAQYDYDEQVAKTQKLIQDNALQRVTNVENEGLAKRDKIDKQIESADAGIGAIDGVLNAMKNVDPAAAQAMANLFKELYGFEISPDDSVYSARARGYDYKDSLQAQRSDVSNDIANNMQVQYDLDKAMMSAAQQAETESKILGYKQDSLASAQEQAQAAKQAAKATEDASYDAQAYRNKQDEYEQYNRRVDMKTASGKLLSTSDYQEGIDLIQGYTDEFGNHVAGLLEMANAEVDNLKLKLEAVEPGTEEYEDLKEALDAAADSTEQLTAELQDMQNAQKDAYDSTAKTLEDALDQNQHNKAMIDARKSTADALGGALGGIGGSIGLGGMDGGAILDLLNTMLGGGAALAAGIFGALENPEGFSMSSLMSSIASSVGSFYAASTPQGNLQEAHGIYGDQIDYYSNELAGMAKDDAQYAETQEKLQAAQEGQVQNEAEQAQAMSDVAGKLGNVASGAKSSAENLIKEIHQIINDFVNWLENRVKRHLMKIEYQLKEISAGMAMTEARGRDVSTEDLLEQIQATQKEIAFYKNTYIPMLKQEVNYTQDENGDRSGAERTQDYQALLQAEGELLDLNVELVKLQRITMRDKLFESIEKTIEKLSEMRTILESISDLITNEMLFDADGQMTKNGQQKLTLLVGQFQAAEAAIQGYKNQIDALNMTRASNWMTEDEYIEQLTGLQKQLLEAAKEEEQYALSYVDILKQQGEEELNQLNEIIDARQEALQAKKDYYDYDKSIREKTKDIQALQAQIAALNGLTDAESKAKRAKLEADLKDAQEDLNDTVKEHEFELASQSLDKLGETLEKSFEDEWDAVTSDLETLLGYMGDISATMGSDEIIDTTKEILSAIGIAIEKIDGIEVDRTQFVQVFGETLKDQLNRRYDDSAVDEFSQHAASTFKQVYGYDLQVFGSKIDAALEAVGLNRAKDDRSPDEKAPPKPLRSWDRIMQALDQLGPILKILFKIPQEIIQLFVGFDGPEENSKADKNLAGFANFLESPAWNLSRAVGAWLGSTDDHFNNDGYGIIGSGIQASKETSSLWQQVGEDIKNGWDKLVNGIKGLFGGHASGSKRIKRDEWAWTQEGHKEEWIVRQSDGAILTPLSKGDGVLPANLTSRLWQLATGSAPTPTMPTYSVPDYNISENYSPNVTYNFDNLLNVEGNVDATVIDDLKKFTSDLAKNKDLLESAYQYTSTQMYKGYLHSGGKRRL